MSKALRANYRFTSQAVSFFDLFADLRPVDDTALAVIQGGLERGVPPSLLMRAARLLQGYEMMYWTAWPKLRASERTPRYYTVLMSQQRFDDLRNRFQ
jgi:hypothetical protein